MEMEEKKDIPLGLLVFSFGWLPAASAAYNPPKDNPSKPSFIPTAAASAVNSLFLHPLAHSEERAEREKGIEWRAAYPTGLH